MNNTSPLEYAYAVGRVRALENKLIPRSTLEEAAEEKDFTQAMKILSEAGSYPEEISRASDSEKLDKFLEKERKNFHNSLTEMLKERVILSILREEDYPYRVLSLAEQCGYSFVLDYIRYRVDLGNLKILLRAKYLELSPEKLKKMVMKGGFLDSRILLQNYNLSFSEIGEKLRASSYQKLWIKAVQALKEKESFIYLEKEIEDFLMEYLQKAKYIVFGPEPVFAYGLAKKKELKMIRLLGVGKLNNIPPQMIKERISETYVG